MKIYYFWRWIELGGGEPLGVDESRCACGSGVHDIFDLLVAMMVYEGDARGRIDDYWDPRGCARLVESIGHLMVRQTCRICQ
jgi:hypothetical protein